MAKAELTLEVSYYNLSHDAWEPILEPVVNDADDEICYTPWTLQAEVLRIYIGMFITKITIVIIMSCFNDVCWMCHTD